MGLIGPRPLLLADQPDEPTVRLVVAPGITGWAQIHGGKLVSAAEKNDLDEWYVHNASLWLDLKILLRTIFIVLTGDIGCRDCDGAIVAIIERVFHAALAI
jgi:lipopolysaccharide/colanic/teichoic acid biosynthesis glycosyltransferase